MKGTSSLSLSQERSERVPSSSWILKHQSFLIARSVTVTLWAFSDVPLLLIVASSNALSRSLLFCATAKRVKQSCSFLFLSLGSLRWAEVCLGWVSCSLRKWYALVRELRWVWQRKAWCYSAPCVAGPMNGANGEQAPGLMVRTGMRIASVTCCSSRSTESASTLSSQPGFSIFFLSHTPSLSLISPLSLSPSRSWTARSWGSSQEQVKAGWGAERDASVCVTSLSSIFYQVNVLESCHKKIYMFYGHIYLKIKSPRWCNLQALVIS